MTDSAQAQLLLDNAILKAAFVAVREDVLVSLADANPTDAEAIQALTVEFQAIAKVEQAIRSFIDSPRVEAFNKRQARAIS